MDILVRCPYCKEALAVDESEVNTPVECPMCRKTFVWAKIIAQRKQAEKEERLKIERERERKLQAQREKRERIAQAQHEAAAKREAQSRLIQWECAVCKAGLCQRDFRTGNAVWENNKAYCHEHVPRTRMCPDRVQIVSKTAPGCPHCGRVFRKRPLKERIYPQPRKSSKLGLIAALVVIVSIVGVIVYFALIAPPPPEEIDSSYKAATMSDMSLPEATIPANTSQAKESVKTTTIYGGAWVIKGGGQSDILRGLEIALCKESVEPEVRRIRDQAEEEERRRAKERAEEIRREFPDLALPVPEIHPSGYLILLHYFVESALAVSRHTIAVVRTNIEGKYAIPDVPQGSYFLYAEYQSAFSAAYWLMPVTVNSTEPITINLDNSNMKECYNKN